MEKSDLKHPEESASSETRSVMLAPLKETFTDVILFLKTENRSFAFVFDRETFRRRLSMEDPKGALAFLDADGKDKAPRPRFVFDICNLNEEKYSYSPYDISLQTYSALSDMISRVEPMEFRIKYGDILDQEICNGKKHYKFDWKRRESGDRYVWRGIVETGEHDESCANWTVISPLRKEALLLMQGLELEDLNRKSQ